MLQDVRPPLVGEPNGEPLEIVQGFQRSISRTTVDSLPYTSTTFTAMRL